MARFSPLVHAVALFFTVTLHADLAGYLALPDSSYQWELLDENELPTARFYNLNLTSQTWQGTLWRHNLHLIVPKKKSPGGSALLIIEGGGLKGVGKPPDAATLLYGALLAEKVGMPVALLKQVPNQPLLGKLREDALIAETFRRYLDTGDETWPLLFPMTKAAVKAMDAVGEFSARELGGRIDRFAVMGASKRGWTTWLTAAIGDPRVVAIAPMVIDMLNADAQAKHQKEVLGRWSEETRDYHALLEREPTDRTRKLWSMVDPYTYREKITQPKLVVLGNNDPYWSTDALNLYWDGLSEPKWIHYVPNAGHDLSPVEAGKRAIPYDSIDTVSAFVRSLFFKEGAPFPKLTWKNDADAAGRPRIAAEATLAPKAAHLWVAHSPTRDFRKAVWEQRPATLEGSTLSGSIDLPATGFIAFYLMADYGYGKLSTQIRIEEATPNPKP